MTVQRTLLRKITAYEPAPDCAWCGEPATEEREIVSRLEREGVLVRPARSVFVCPYHSEMIDRNLRMKELPRLISQLRGVLHSGRAKDPDGTQRRIERLEAELEELTR